jgi:ABC-type Mn2+/Zn2+ transport system permease subunit
MERQSTWQRLDAQRWVHVIYLIQTTLLSLAAFFLVPAALALGVVLVAPLAVLPAVLMGALTRGWRRGRPWSWWMSSVLATSGLALALIEGPSVGSVIGSVVNAGLLLLLFHPDCRERIDGPVEDLRPPRDPAAAWVGRDY